MAAAMLVVPAVALAPAAATAMLTEARKEAEEEVGPAAMDATVAELGT